MRNTTLYKLAGPKTFRRGSTKVFGKWGSNLQNIEKSLRAIYTPDGFTPEVAGKCKYWIESGDLSIFSEEELVKIKVMSQADQQGAEALAVAYLCRNADYRQLFINGIKPHVYVAMKLFKDVWKEKIKQRGSVDVDVDLLAITPIPLLKQNPEWKILDNVIKDSDNWAINERYYYLAKQTCHSANYGINAPTFRMNILDKSGGKIVLSKKSSEEFLLVYRGLFPEIPEWNDFVKETVIKYKLLYNLLGFPYQITDYNITEHKYKEYVAWIPQSTIGEITRTAFCDLQEYIEAEKKPWDILNDCHDSYLVQGPLLDVAERTKKMQEFMGIEMTSPIDGVKFRMKSEAQVGFNWGPYDKNNPDKNPFGLRELEWLKN